MAKIFSTEKSRYINKNADIYAKNRIGQFSKFLDKNPVFVTYYAINQQETRADVGSGSIKSEIGSSSPVRYNEIKEFPIYGLGVVSPELNDDEFGIDISMDLSGVEILPNTIKPAPGDYIYLQIPGMEYGMMIRVNSFEYVTLQSNAAYRIDLDLKGLNKLTEDTITNAEDKHSKIQNQVVERYLCIFDNIGTNDKCLIKTTDYEIAKKVYQLIENLKSDYYDNFYRNGTFLNITPTYLYNYDLYLTKFIKENGLYINSDTQERVILVYYDLHQTNFNVMYKQTLWYALEKRDSNFLSRNAYYYPYNVVNQNSPLLDMDAPAETLGLVFNDGPIIQPDLLANPYFNQDLLSNLKDNIPPEEGRDYFDILIYNYINESSIEPDTEYLSKYAMIPNMYNYIYVPAIIYVLQSYFNDIFKSEKLQLFNL